MELRHHPLQSLTRISSRKECDALHSLEGQQQGQDPSRWEGGGVGGDAVFLVTSLFFLTGLFGN
jgi:hypothetical protein